MPRRGPAPTKAEFIVGPVRVVRSTKGFRVLWYENGRQRERTATSRERAEELAREEEARLAGQTGGLSTPDTNFGALVAAAIDPSKHQWSENWATRMQRNARLHVIPIAKDLTCREVTRETLIGLLSGLAAEGYSYYTIEKVHRVLTTAAAEGINRGIWTDQTNPMRKVGVANGDLDKESGHPDRSLIPTDAQVEALIASLRETRLVYGVMAQVAAGSGLRWGELMALRESAIDLPGRALHVHLTCVEMDSGRFRFHRPRKTKRNNGVREVRLDSPTVEALKEWLSVWDPHQIAPAVEGTLFPDLLFQTRSGNPFRRSAMGSVFRRHIAKLDSWPNGASWHYLRHYAATRWLRLGVEVPTVSKWLGHAQVSTTYDWYVDVDADAFDRAAEILP